MGWSDYTTEDRTALTSKYNIYQALAKALNERMLYVNPWGVPFTMAHGSLIPDAKRLVDRYRKNIIVNSQSWDAPFSYYFDDMLDRLIGWWG